MYRDLTRGSILRSLLLFALPMLAGDILQQLYNIADTLIVSRAIGRDALAAVGSAYTLMIFLTSILLGLSMGAGALFSICRGRGDESGLRQSIVHAFALIGVCTLLLTALAYALLPALLRLLQVPESVSPLMRTYLAVIFAGIPATFLYNFFACLLRSVGNSMTFAHNLLGADECRMGITALCDNVGRRLRKRGMVCQTVQLGIRDPEFHNRSRQITLERPTNSTRTLIDLSMQLLLGHWPMDKPVRLLSVTAANLLPENQSCEQLSLFDAAEDIQKRDRQHKLDQTVDALRQKFGDQSVVFAHSVKKKDKTDKT